MNDTEDRLRRLLTAAAPDLGGVDPDTLLVRTSTAGRRGRVTRLTAVAASVAVVAAVVAGVSLLSGRGGGGRPAAAPPTASPSAGSFPDIPASVFDAVGLPARPTQLRLLTGPALIADGRPELLYIDADWAPYAAAERWALAAALSRFGTFTGLGTTTSKRDDAYPDTATISFRGARYTSPYLTVVFRDIQDRAGKPLDQLTASEKALFNAPGGNAFPFLDIAGRHRLVGAQFNPAVLAGLTPEQIAGQLTDPQSPVAQAVIGAANELTAAICDATGGRPAEVCPSSGAGG